MRCLKAGGSSTNAVAVALKLLEDNDITNAGIGSNLTVDGRVECDATIVDHFGRSGACGAVPSKFYLSLTRSPFQISYQLTETNFLYRHQEPDLACKTYT